MKKILLALFIFALGLLSIPLTTHAQVSALWQGGTGWNTSVTGDMLIGTSSVLRYTRLPIGTAGYVLQSNGITPSWVATSSLGIIGGGGVTSVSGTVNRITSTGGATPIIDISGSYIGQASITTLGTITTGVWNGTAITNANLANSTISGVSLGNNLAGLNVDSTLTGVSYNGGVARTFGLNLASENVWTAASTTFVGVTMVRSTTTNATTTTFAISGLSNTVLAVDGNGSVIATTTGGGSGSGTVNAGTTGQMPYYAANGTTLTATSSIFIDAMSEVGIGSTSPSTKLSVHDSSGVATTTGVFVVASSTTAGTATTTLFKVYGNGDFSAGIDNGRNGVNINGRDLYFGNEANTNQAIFFRRNATTVGALSSLNSLLNIAGGSAMGNVAGMNIDSSNRFGLNDSSPDYKFEIAGFITNGYFGITRTNDGDVFNVSNIGYVGVGTTTPSAQFSVHASTTRPVTDFVMAIATSSVTGTGTTTLMSLTGAGVLTTSGNIANCNSCTISAGATSIGNSTVFIPASGFIAWNGRSAITSESNGTLTLNNSAGTDFTRLNFGGTTSSFPGLSRTGTAINLTLADGTNGGTLNIGTTTLSSVDRASLFAASTGSTTKTTIAAQAIPSQTANLYDGLSASGVSVFSVGPSGSLIANSISTTNSIQSGNRFIASGSSVGDAGFKFSNDFASGMFSPSAGVIGFTNATAETMRISATGNVGIGTSTPSFRLDVVGAPGQNNIANFASSTGVTVASIVSKTGTTTAYYSSDTAGFGGEVVLEDIDGAGCTSITTLDGVVSAKIVTCP